MIETPLYPIAAIAALLASTSIVAARAAGRPWGIAMAITAALQIGGYIIVARMMYTTGGLFPQQLAFAAAATALTTKLVVFAPTFVGRLADPTYVPSLDRHTIVSGLLGAWLIQASLAVLYLFPDTILRNTMMWLLPTTAVHVYLWPLLAGALLAQVTIAANLYDHAEAQALQPTNTQAAELELEPAVVTDGGDDADGSE